MMTKMLVLFLLLAFPVGSEAFIETAFEFLNSILSSFIDDSQVCTSLVGSISAGLLTCNDCNAQLVHDGTLRFKMTADASCTVAGAVNVSVTGESENVGFLDPFMKGGIKVFDPFGTSLTLDVAGGYITVDSESHLLSTTPNSTVVGASGTVPIPVIGGYIGCNFEEPFVKCGSVACFNPSTFEMKIPCL